MATGVGLPAALGAAARAVATARGLLNDPFAEPLVRAAGVPYFTKVVDDERFAANDENPQTKLLDVLAAHTRLVDEFLAEAGRSGVRQVVILAPGLDARPYRLWWPRGMTIYEIDRPEVLDIKAEALRQLRARPAANRCAVGVDLRDDWLSALRRAGFDAGTPTAWVAEQLLVGYLTPDDQHRLLHGVIAASAAGSRLAADHMPTWTPLQPEAERAFVDGWRQHGLEVDLASLTYPGQYHYVPEYLADHGWRPLQRNEAEVLGVTGLAAAPRGGPDDPASRAEYVTAIRP